MLQFFVDVSVTFTNYNAACFNLLTIIMYLLGDPHWKFFRNVQMIVVVFVVELFKASKFIKHIFWFLRLLFHLRLGLWLRFCFRLWLRLRFWFRLWLRFCFRLWLRFWLRFWFRLWFRCNLCRCFDFLFLLRFALLVRFLFGFLSGGFLRSGGFFLSFAFFSCLFLFRFLFRFSFFGSGKFCLGLFPFSLRRGLF